jgi:biopolymer transport protein ExbD
MGLKKRNKINAEFNMSAMTDIIFLLLIFFMLTSKVVNVKPFELPESNVKTVAPASLVLSVTRDGVFALNNEPLESEALESSVQTAIEAADNKEEITMTIVAEVGTPFDNVTRLMRIAAQNDIKAILATQPTS